MEIFANEPRESDNAYNFYRAFLEKVKRTGTLGVKFKFLGCPRSKHKYIPEEVTKLFGGRSTGIGRNTTGSSKNTSKTKDKRKGKGSSRDLPTTVVMIAAVTNSENEAHRKAKELFSAIAEHTVMGPPEYFSSERFETMWQSELKLLSSDSAERQPSSSCKRRKTNGKKRKEKNT